MMPKAEEPPQDLTYRKMSGRQEGQDATKTEESILTRMVHGVVETDI